MQEKNKVAEKPLKRKGTLIWGSICLIISFWMFCLGILVGRGKAPVEFDIQALQKELSELKRVALEKTLQRYQTDSKKADGKTELEFYEALKRTQDSPRPPIKSSKADTIKPPEKKQSPLSPATVHSGTNTVASVEQKEVSEGSKSTGTTAPIKVRAETFKKVKPDIKTSSPSSPAAWTIQVAALKDASEADRMVSQLSQKGYAAYKLTGEVPGKGVWHRVRVGRYRQREETAAVINRLATDQYRPIPINTGETKP